MDFLIAHLLNKVILRLCGRCDDLLWVLITLKVWCVEYWKYPVRTADNALANDALPHLPFCNLFRICRFKSQPLSTENEEKKLMRAITFELQ